MVTRHPSIAFHCTIRSADRGYKRIITYQLMWLIITDGYAFCFWLMITIVIENSLLWPKSCNVLVVWLIRLCACFFFHPRNQLFDIRNIFTDTLRLSSVSNIYFIRNVYRWPWPCTWITSTVSSTNCMSRHLINWVDIF